MATTYKSVITQAIDDFNDIQTALAGLGAKYKFDGSSTLTAIPAVSTKLIPTKDLDAIISEQLQLKASGKYTVSASGDDIDISKYQYIYVPSATKSNDTFSAGSFTTGINTSSSTISFLASKPEGTDGTDYFSVTSSGSGTANSSKHTINISKGFLDSAIADSHIGTPSLSSNTTKYIAKARLTGTVSGTSSKPTINAITTKSTTNATNLTVTTPTAGIGVLTTTAPTTGYYLNIQPTVGTTTATISKSGLTEGYLKASDQISISGSITGSSGSSYYIPMDAATCTIDGGKGSGSISLNKITPASVIATTTTETPYYIDANASGSWAVTAITDSYTAGYLPTKSSTNCKDAQSGNMSRAASRVYIQKGVLAGVEASNTNYKDYTDLSGENVIIPSEGYLVLNAGYYPNSKISLDSLLGGAEDAANFNNKAYLRSGYIAYNEDGKQITGAMADVNPTFTISVKNGTPSSSTTITAITTSPANKGAAINYNDNKLGGTAEASEYVTISATGSGGASAASASSSYAASTTGYLDKSAGTSAGSANATSGVSTTSKDTNYIPASSTSEITANAATLTTNASFSKSTTSPTNKGTAIHYTDNKLGGTAEASYYVTIAASSSGSATAGSAKTLSVKDKYMLNNISVKSAAISSATTANGATAYIPAHNGGSLSLTAGTISGSVNVVQHIDAATNKGFAKCYDSANLGGTAEASYYVKVEASGSASASAPSGSITVKDKYMLGNISASGGSISSTGLTGNTNYIPADNTTSAVVKAGTISGSVGSATVGSATIFNSSTGAIKTAGSKSSSISGSASATAGSGGTLTLKDKYMLNNISYSGTAINTTSLTAGTASIAADATGSSVDTYVESLYKRMLGQAYTAVSAD